MGENFDVAEKLDEQFGNNCTLPRYAEDNLDRIVDEILGDVDMWIAGHGPNGPWFYRSLTVTRNANVIHIEDVDGEPVGIRNIADISHVGDKHAAVREELDLLNRRSLDRL